MYDEHSRSTEEKWSCWQWDRNNRCCLEAQSGTGLILTGFSRHRNWQFMFWQKWSEFFLIYQQTYTDNVTGRLGFVMQMIRVRAKINSQFQQSTNYNNKKLHVHLLTLLTQLSDLWFLIYTFNFNFEHRLRFSETHNETTITPIKSQQNVFFSMWIRHFRPCQVFLKAQLFKLLIWMAE